MKLVSKSTINRFSNQTYSMGSMMELMGRQPHHIGGYIRLKNQYSLGLLTITEALGNVYMEEKGYTKLKEIDTYSFTWDVEASQIPTVRFTRDATISGNAPQVVYMDDKYFSKYDIFALENTQQLYVVAEPERVAANEYKYTVVNGFHSSIQAAFTAKNKTARYLYNAHPEFSEYGTNKHHYNTERHINYMTKIRAGQPYSGDFRATQELYFMEDGDLAKAQKEKGGTYKIFKLSSIEQQVLEHFLRSANGMLLFGRSSMSETSGRSKVQVDQNQDVITGDGIIAQYERYAYYIDYSNNKLDVKDFQDAIEYIAEKRGQSQGNHITVLCNRVFSRQKATALQNAVNTFATSNDGTWFFSKDTDEVYGAKDAFGGTKRLKRTKLPHEIAVGATFNSYIYEGNVVTFIVDEALSKHYTDRGYAIFIDTGVYEDETGQVPAVHLKTLKGRALVKNYINGMGGMDGRSNGDVATALDASRFEVLGWRGACVRNPFSAVIFSESV